MYVRIFPRYKKNTVCMLGTVRKEQLAFGMTYIQKRDNGSGAVFLFHRIGNLRVPTSTSLIHTYIHTYIHI